MKRFLASRKAFPSIVAALLVLPHCFSSRGSNSFLHLGPPRVTSGDEPHYLVIIHSILDDWDVDVSNQYRSVNRDGIEAGIRFAGARLGHLTTWYEGDERRRWMALFHRDRETWWRDPSGRWIPRLRATGEPFDFPGPEYPTHSIGMPILVSLAAYPFRGTTAVEPVAIACSGLALLLALIAFRRLCFHLSDDAAAVNIATAAAFLGTPVWHYGRTLFAEPYLTACAVVAFTLFAVRGSSLWAGLPIGLGILIKPPFALVGVPIGLALLASGEVARAMRFSLFPALAVLCLLWANHLMFGSPWRPAHPWDGGNPLEGLIKLALSPNHGVLPYAPFLVAVLAAWPRFLRAHRKVALISAAGAGAYFLLFSSFQGWHGGGCFGPRHVVPVLPLAFVGALYLPGIIGDAPRLVRLAILGLLALSIAINALGALPYWSYWSRHPLLPL